MKPRKMKANRSYINTRIKEYRTADHRTAIFRCNLTPDEDKYWRSMAQKKGVTLSRLVRNIVNSAGLSLHDVGELYWEPLVAYHLGTC